MTRAWAAEQQQGSVKALKITIECAQVLADTKVLQFYPRKFVLITDILDTFGKLVADRMYRKCAYYPPGSNVPECLPPNFTPDMVPAHAKESVRNWFFKIASIRELVPRIYVEIAILRCYSFLFGSSQYDLAFLKLTSLIRGVGDPLVALYIRMYLCRVSMKIAPELKRHLIPVYHDTLVTYQQVTSGPVRKQMEAEEINLEQYLDLWVPAVDWILRCVAYRAVDGCLEKVLSKTQKMANLTLFFNAIMVAFPQQEILARIVQFSQLIASAKDSGLSKCQLHLTLGLVVGSTALPKHKGLAVLKNTGQLRDPAQYIVCVEAWLECHIQEMPKHDIDVLLSDCINYMTPNRAFEKFYPQLQSIVHKIVASMKNVGELFLVHHFIPFINMLQNDAVSVDVCEAILDSFHAWERSSPIHEAQRLEQLKDVEREAKITEGFTTCSNKDLQRLGRDPTDKPIRDGAVEQNTTIRNRIIAESRTSLGQHQHQRNQLQRKANMTIRLTHLKRMSMKG